MSSTGPVLITGGAGLLGQALIEQAPHGIDLHATQRHTPVRGASPHTIELSDGIAVASLFRRLRPRLVIHTAYSMQAGERDIWQATRHVVDGCQATGATLLYLSTDALLDGTQGPYAESAEPAPLHEYGRWKARAELLVRAQCPDAAVVRTSLITQFAPLDPRSAWVAGALRAGEPITLYVDELRCPILPTDLARQLWEVSTLPDEVRGGVWHLAGPEALSRYAIGLLIAAHEGLDPSGIVPAEAATSATPRPRDLRLLTTRADQALSTRARPLSALALPRPI